MKQVFTGTATIFPTMNVQAIAFQRPDTGLSALLVMVLYTRRFDLCGR